MLEELYKVCNVLQPLLACKSSCYSCACNLQWPVLGHADGASSKIHIELLIVLGAVGRCSCYSRSWSTCVGRSVCMCWDA